jgi:hypothetical protein
LALHDCGGRSLSVWSKRPHTDSSSTLTMPSPSSSKSLLLTDSDTGVRCHGDKSTPADVDDSSSTGANVPQRSLACSVSVKW